jgi:hypothetical protein
MLGFCARGLGVGSERGVTDGGAGPRWLTSTSAFALPVSTLVVGGALFGESVRYRRVEELRPFLDVRASVSRSHVGR